MIPPGRGTISWTQVLANALAGGAASSVLSGAGLGWIGLGSLLGGLAGWILSAPNSPRVDTTATSWSERIAPAVLLLFFLPAFRLPVPPGADMAMQVALARPLLSGQEILSPAWGPVHASAYPRGFSAWIALLSVPFGLAKAGLLTAGIAYSIYYLGLRAYFRDLARSPYPASTAALCLLLCKTPQSFFGWGGNATVLALGLGLLAAAMLSAETEASPVRRGLGAALLLVGAGSCHPIGAFAAMCVVCMVPLRRPTRSDRMSGFLRWGPAHPRLLLATGLAVSALIGTLALLSFLGPELSVGERAWIREYQQTTEQFLKGPRWAFPLGLLRGLPKALGDPAALLFLAALVDQLRRPSGRKRAGLALLALFGLAFLLTVGPDLPPIGILVFPARFTPLLVLILAPLAAHSARDLFVRWPRTTRSLGVALLLLGLVRHVGWFQTREGLATGQDLETIRCLESVEEATTLVDGAYADGTQWIPALTGIAIRNPHIHISVQDEVTSLLATSKPTYYFVGERTPVMKRASISAGEGTEICGSGESRLYRLLPASALAR